MSFTLEGALQSLKDAFGGSINETSEFRGQTSITIDKDSFTQIAEHIKNELGFTYLLDITAVDHLGNRTPRYDVVYHINRFGPDIDENIILRLKVPLPEDDPKIQTATSIWRGANWLEREIYDMFGLNFIGHPDPRRMLLPEHYEAFPLRKDFDVRNREPAKRSFARALKDLETDFDPEEMD